MAELLSTMGRVGVASRADGAAVVTFERQYRDEEDRTTTLGVFNRLALAAEVEEILNEPPHRRSLGALALRWAQLADEIEAVNAARSLTWCAHVAREHWKYDFTAYELCPCWKNQYEPAEYDELGCTITRGSFYRHRDPMCAECARFVDISDHRRALVRQRAAIQGAIRRTARRAHYATK